MRVRPVALIGLSVTLLASAIGCAKQEPPKPAVTAAPAADGKTLFEAKCSVCHGLDRATSLTGTKETWTSIVKKMQGKKADWISDADASKIIDYLTTEHGKK